MLSHIDLCSGIGGFALGLQRAGLSKPVLFCDIEPWSRKVLRKHWPDVPIAKDVKELANDPIGLIPDTDPRRTILTAGYPCQSFSLAGKRRGTEDDRHIWPYIFSIIQARQPAWCIFENVSGHITMGLDQVLSDLADKANYAVQTFHLGAVSVDAPHRRMRLWIIARNVGYTQHNGSSSSALQRSFEETSNNNTQGQIKASQFEGASQSRNSEGMEASTRADNVADTESKRHRRGSGEERGAEQRIIQPGKQGGSSLGSEVEGRSSSHGKKDVADTESLGVQRHRASGKQKPYAHEGQTLSLCRGERPREPLWPTEPRICRVANGIPSRVDRIRGLGNAIVPQIAQMIGETIKQCS